MKSIRALRALLRLELRQLRRHRGRSLLMLMLVALPVAAMVGGAGLLNITEAQPEERARRVMGAADLRVEELNPWEDLERARDHLPADAETLWGFVGMERVSVPGRRLPARLVALEPGALEPEARTTTEESADRAIGSPALATNMVRLLEGRAPEHAGEVALSPPLLEGLGCSLGDAVTLEYGTSRVITGVVVDPEDLQLPLVLRTPAASEHPVRRFLLASYAADLSAAQRSRIAENLRQDGFEVLTREEAATGDNATTVFVFALGILGLFEAALVISAAFGVSLRRRQVEIGLLGSTGADRAAILRSMLVSVALLAVLGGVLGSLAAIAGLAAIHPFLDSWTHRLCGPLVISSWHSLGAIMLGVLASVLAAVAPARGAARLPIRQALAGRRPSPGYSRKGLLLGILCVTIGVGLLGLSSHQDSVMKALGVGLGPIFSIIGFGLCSPFILQWAARRAASLPLAWRLAVRDAGRFRERNGAVVTAVLAGMAMSVTLASLVGSLETAVAELPSVLRDDQLMIAGPGAESAAPKIADSLSARVAVALPAVYFHGEPLRGKLDGQVPRRRNPWIAVGDEDLLTALGAEQGRQDFLDGKLLMLDTDPEVAHVSFHSWVSDRRISTPAVSRVSTDQRVREPVFLLHHAALAGHGLETGPPPRSSLVPWLIRLDRPVAKADLETARLAATETARTEVDAGLLYNNKFRSFYRWVLLICALTGVLIVVTATALSAVESAADEKVLHTLGAAPVTLRRHQAARAGYLALLGCSLAVPGGLLAAGALIGAVNLPVEFVVPWRDLAVVVFGLPTLIYIGAWWLTRPFGISQGSLTRIQSES